MYNLQPARSLITEMMLCVMCQWRNIVDGGSAIYLHDRLPASNFRRRPEIDNYFDIAFFLEDKYS